MAAKSMTGEICAIKNGEGLKETATSFPVNCKWRRTDGVELRRRYTRDREKELKERSLMNYGHV